MKFHPRMVVVLSLILLVYGAINFYIGWHLTLWLEAAQITYEPGVLWAIFGIVAFGYFLGRIPLPKALKPVGRLFKVIGSYYIFIFEMGLLLLLLADVGALVAIVFGGDTAVYTLYAGIAVLAGIVLLLAIGSRNAFHPIVRDYVLEVDKPAGPTGDWTIAVASDIHLGNVIGNRHLRKLVDAIDAMKPDLVLLPGDVIDDSIEPFIRNKMSATLGRLKAKQGVYAVLGNHEYYGGHIGEYVEEMRNIGIKVLQDETVEIDGSLYIVGRKDKTAESAEPGGRKTVEELLTPFDLAKPVILMDHQPTKFQLAADAGVDLMLSGHTHRGQFAPNHLFTKRMFELDWGYLKKGGMHVVVSSGFGLWGPPVRLGSRSEIIRISIRFRS